MLAVKTSELSDAIKFVSNALSGDNSRPVLQNNHIFIQYGRLVIEAVDGYTCARKTIGIVQNDNSDESINALLVLPRIKSNKYGNSTIEVSGKNVIITDQVEQTSFTIKVMDCTFINLDKIKPEEKDNQFEVYFSADKLSSALKQYGKETVLIKFNKTGPCLIADKHEDSFQLVCPCRKF